MIHITQRFHVFHDQKVLYLEKNGRVKKMAIYNVSLPTSSSECKMEKEQKDGRPCSLNRPMHVIFKGVLN